MCLASSLRSFFAVALLSACLGATPAFAAISKESSGEGLLNLNRDWTGADYARAAELFRTGKLSLPRLSDPAGALFIKRITAVSNLTVLRDSGLPLEDRVLDYAETLKSLQVIYSLYRAQTSGRDGHIKEWAHFMAFALKSATVGMDLMDELTRRRSELAVDPKLRGAQTRMRFAYAQIVTWFCFSLSVRDAEDYPVEISLVIDAMAEILPRVRKTLPLKLRAVLSERLELTRKSITATGIPEQIAVLIQLLGGGDSPVTQIGPGSIEFLWAGIYVKPQPTIIPNPGAPDGQITIPQPHRFERATSQIPAKIGTRFGVAYSFNEALDGDSVAHRIILRHPAETAAEPGKVAAVLEDEIQSVCVVNAECVAGWQLQDKGDLRAGTWTFEIWYGEQMLLKQSFEIVTN